MQKMREAFRNSPTEHRSISKSSMHFDGKSIQTF